MEPQEIEALPKRARLRALVGADLLGATVGWNLTNVGAAAEVTARHFGVPLEAVGLFTTALFLGQLLLLVAGSRLIDQFGPRRLGLICLLGLGVVNLATTALDSMMLALLLRFFLGVAAGVGFVAGSAYVKAAGGSVLAQGLYGGVLLAGAGLAIGIVPALIDEFAWRAPFVSAAVAVMPGVVALLAAPPLRSGTGGMRPTTRDVVTDRRLLRFGMPQAATFGLSIVLGNWVVSLLVRHGDYPATTAGAIGGLVLFGGIVGRPLGGTLAARFPDSSRTLVTSSMLLGGIATLMLTAAQPAMLAIVSSLLIGVAAGIPFGPMYHAVTHLRSDAPAAAIAVFNLPAILLLIVGTPLLGLSFSHPSAGRLGFILAAGIWAASALLVPSRSLFPTDMR